MIASTRAATELIRRAARPLMHLSRLTRSFAGLMCAAAVWAALGAVAPGLAGPRAQESPPPGFDAWFTGGTMRVDYFHTGGPAGEVVALDRVVSDGPWPGSRSRLLDPTNLGKYLFEVVDRRTRAVIYSRGFASLYGEWETTPEVRTRHRTFHESLRFPWPRDPVEVVLKKRQRDNGFVEIWTAVVDPASRFVNRQDVPPAGPVWSRLENGPPATRLDILILGDGYPAARMDEFHADARRLVGRLFEYEPFRSRRADFNVRVLDLPSPAAGVSRPRAGVFRRTPLSAEFNVFDSERYLLTHDNRALRDAASSAPYEIVSILVNEAQYGGGGIFNFHSTASVDNPYSEYVFVHEIGHLLAGLADEYYTSDVAYETGAAAPPEPWEPNVTALHDPSALKWRDLVEPSTPIPTPWDKEAYERRSSEMQAQRRALVASGAPQAEVDRLFRAEEDWLTGFLRTQPHAGRVGAYEGASYEPKGLFRPEADCIMFSRNRVGFCRVCRGAIERVIDLYSRP